jgi:predicted Co/Zn/Cd cation transporter (cation efflux family)
MKRLFVIIFLLGFVNLSAATKQDAAAKSTEKKQGFERNSDNRAFEKNLVLPFDTEMISGRGQKWGVFWINFAIATVGMYSIYGFAAGIISAGVTYFVVNGDKKSFHMAIWGALAGMLVGLGLRLLYLYA